MPVPTLRGSAGCRTLQSRGQHADKAKLLRQQEPGQNIAPQQCLRQTARSAHRGRQLHSRRHRDTFLFSGPTSTPGRTTAYHVRISVSFLRFPTTLETAENASRFESLTEARGNRISARNRVLAWLLQYHAQTAAHRVCPACR